ncbi:hypothetical protein ABUL04_04770 [Micromonospora harpali]|uniref:DUF4231 domain-containing protein n=1 Tax=Micromonospora harpali TaxID=1490225 RepID=A0ABW1HJ59_9ACTN
MKKGHHPKSATDGPRLSSLTETEQSFELERYKYILQQLHIANENVHRFLSLYQTITTTLAAAGIALFVSFKDLGLPATTARSGMLAIMLLITSVGAFTALQVIAGISSWFDYRREECALTDEAVRPGFRRPPTWRNFYRWYETYTLAFIVGTLILLWVAANQIIFPRIAGQ